MPVSKPAMAEPIRRRYLERVTFQKSSLISTTELFCMRNIANKNTNTKDNNGPDTYHAFVHGRFLPILLIYAAL